MHEFNLESVFLSYFLKQKFNFADYPEATLNNCPGYNFEYCCGDDSVGGVSGM